MVKLNSYKMFDSHFHIIDSRFPLIANQGYLPDNFTVADYRAGTERYEVVGGAVVSGSFQAFDQSYLLAALAELGSGFVGVTQLPATVTDDELLSLNRAGVRALRFNLRRGGSEKLQHLDRFARRIYDVVGWHVELYVDAKDLADLRATLIDLPAVCIDHLGLSAQGLSNLFNLIEQGIFVKATGFGRVNSPVKETLQQLVAINPDVLVFGTDLPSTRAPRPYADDDFRLIVETFDSEVAEKILCGNARNLYRMGRAS